MKKQPKMSRWLVTAALSLLVMMLAACQAPASTPTEPASPAAPTQARGETDTGTALPTSGASDSPPAAAATAMPESATPTPLVLEGAQTTASGLQYLEENAGSGENPKTGEIVTIHYIVSLVDGTELANTYTMNQPASLPWGDNRLLPGWEEGVGMMKPGGKATLVLPPDLAFGEEGVGGIPANSQLVIEVELLTIKPAPVPSEIEAT
ncbi:MAG TPA: FKBP-type peptidyl-prolyl cis-trans isomerase, partial [Anaerolineales bacterium]|nr:FKBP-type peptidyl-prolyl cis-trans isomerase [Anaerolineales bacterium]